MSGALDRKARKLAAKLVERFGRTLTYQRRSGAGYSPTTGQTTSTFTDSTVVGLVTLQDPQPVSDGSATEKRVVLVTIPASSLSFAPTAGDRIKDPSDSNRLYLITEKPEALQPGNSPILWKLRAEATA